MKNGRKKNWLTGNAASDYSCHLHGQEPLTGEGRILTAHPENLWIKDSDWNWNPLLDIWNRKSSAPIRYLDINESSLIFCFFAKKNLRKEPEVGWIRGQSFLPPYSAHFRFFRIEQSRVRYGDSMSRASARLAAPPDVLRKDFREQCHLVKALQYYG